MRVIISNAQRRVKDSFAPCPKIDLTLRCNGEEQVCVIDALGNVIRAGIEAPTVAATVAAGAGAAVWEPAGLDTYWAYQYVYVAKNAYPLVQNAVTGNGSPAPRSNPSPSASANSTSDPTKTRIVSIPTSQRSDISHIWIYRTELLTTAAEATDFAAAGNLFWVGETTNNPNATTVDFTDVNVGGLDQIENDNFLALQARYCVFVDPYFWMIGNDVHQAPVTVTSTGLVTRTDGDFWFNGRNAQTASFDGITSGGYDNHGNYYVKILTSSTLQLYLDLALTTTAGLPSTGTTQISIRGQSTTLYRSKPRNPFSWGFTDLVNDIQVPTPYLFSVGGGRTTALGVIPNLNLLKIDVDSPARTYTLNLKNAGTPSFEQTLRPIADNYCTSLHFTQFSATVEGGRNFVWGLDAKSFAIVQCDGASQTPISDNIWKSLRNLSLNGSDQILFHGSFLPRLDLNCIFVRTEGEDGLINKCYFQHWPTGYWGSRTVFDILCSATLFDPFTRELKMFVGNSVGMIGEFGAEDQWTDWVSNAINPTSHIGLIGPSGPPYNYFDEDASGIDWTLQNGIIGNWLYMYIIGNASVLDPANPIQRIVYNRFFARIANVQKILTPSTYYHFIFDKLLDINLVSVPSGSWTFLSSTVQIIIGGIEMRAGKYFNGGLPFDYKKLEEVLSNFYYPIGLSSTKIKPQLAFGLNYHDLLWDVGTPTSGVASIQPFQQELLDYNETNMINASADTSTDGLTGDTNRVIFGKKTAFPIDQSTVFGIIVSDYNTMEAQLMNYEIRLSTDIEVNNRGSNN